MFENITPEVIKRRIFDALEVDVDTREGSYTDALIGPAALEIWKVYAGLNALLPMVYPDETSGEYIDKKCAYYGITRKVGAAAGVTLTVTGSSGTTVPKGAVFLTAEGLRFTADEAFAVADGTASVPATAAEVGAKYNVGVGQIVRQAASIPGVTGVTNPEAAAGGADPETDAALLGRLYTRLREAATSGNVSSPAVKVRVKPVFSSVREPPEGIVCTSPHALPALRLTRTAASLSPPACVTLTTI